MALRPCATQGLAKSYFTKSAMKKQYFFSKILTKITAKDSFFKLVSKKNLAINTCGVHKKLALHSHP